MSPLIVFALAAARLVPVFLLAPFFGGDRIPSVARIGFALAVAAVVYPGAASSAGAATAADGIAAAAQPPIALLLLKECLVGALLGFLAQLPFAALEAGGRLIDTARGANLAEVLVPDFPRSSSAAGALYLELGLVLFLLADGHLLFLRGLAVSYQALPLLRVPVLGAGSVRWLALLTGRVIESAVLLSAPALLALLLADLTLGFFARLLPAFNSFFAGMPLKAGLGLVIVFLGLPALVATVSLWSSRLLGALLRVLRSLS